MDKSNKKNFIPNWFCFTELIKTNTGISNYPDSSLHLANLSRLWYVLNKLRTEFGYPIIINSAFRRPSVNKAVGGAENSYHLQGLAADIRTLPFLMDNFRKFLNDTKNHYPNLFVEFIDKETFFHIAI